jgi:hypothetical protein
MSNFLIGISGVARSGKDTFAELLEKEFSNHPWLNDIPVLRMALANQLKKEVREECLKRFNIDSFTTIKREKDIIRPFLVRYGKKYRIQSDGTHWTNQIQQELKKIHSSVIIITDIRYCIYENDEVGWLKQQKGLLIHVARYDHAVKNKILPPNDDEAFNDPILEALADFKVVWPTTDNVNIKRLFAKEFVNRYGRRIRNNK